MKSVKSLVLATMFVSVAAVANAEVAPDDVKIVDGVVADSLTGQAGNAEEGAKYFKNRKLGNCLACHVNSDMKDQLFHGEVGPTLDGVAGRWSAEELRAILVDAKVVLGEATIMPGFYTSNVGVRVTDKFAGKTILTAQQLEDVIAYLQTLKE